MAASIFGVPRISVRFCGEGGAFATDGKGTLITTRSCLLNPNRNPVRRNVDRQQKITNELAKLGFRKIIWLEGNPCEPITSGHADGYVLCAPRRVVLVEAIDDKDIEPPLWREHDIALMKNARDAESHKFRILRVPAPRRRYWRRKSDTFAPCYLNAYIANDAVIAGRYGDTERDEVARVALAKTFPQREIVLLRIDHIADGGGGMHCLTQPMFRISSENKAE